MAFVDEMLNLIYDKTTGYCHICHKKLAFKNYGICGERSAWEVEHSKPRANGGTDHLNNLYAACIPCNRSKGKKNTRSVRKKNGKTRAPLSEQRRMEAKADNAVVAGLLGAVLGSVFGPLGAVVTSAIAARLAYKKNPDESWL